MSETAAIAITTVFSLLLIVDVVGNSLVCAILTKNRNMRTPMNYLLLNLAVADILYATFIAPDVFFKLTVNHPDGVTGSVLCKLLTGGNVARVGAVSSFIIFVAVAIERYYAVIHPLDNKGKLTKRKLKVIVPGVWISSIILNIAEFLVLNIDEKSNSCEKIWPEEWMGKIYQTLKWNILTAFTLLVMVVTYSRVVYTLWFKRNDDNQLTHQQRGVLKVRKRVTLMVVAVSVIFAICWGTTEVVYTLKLTASYNVGPIPVAIANTMVLFNAAVNPFVYALLNQQFREKMKRMICCTGSFTNRVHPTSEPQGTELANTNDTHPSHTAGSCSLE